MSLLRAYRIPFVTTICSAAAVIGIAASVAPGRAAEAGPPRNASDSIYYPSRQVEHIAIANDAVAGAADFAPVNGGVASQRPAGSFSSVVQVGRHDRFRLTAASRVCVETTIDPAVRTRIEESGERVDEAGFSGAIISGVSERFANLGLFTYVGSPERLRVNPYVDEIVDHSCLEARGNVLVRQHIGSDASGRGYRIAIEASQGERRYSVAIERSSIITISGEAREMVAPDADVMPGTGTPFWDVFHDTRRLSKPLIDHIFRGSRL